MGPESACSLTAIHAGGTILTVKRKFHVTLIEDDEGVSVSCPELPGCHSQGETEGDALANIQTAIQEYLAVVAEQIEGAEVREVEVPV